MKILPIEQNTPDWHALRAKSIGASDCSAIMGNNPWKTEWQLFQEKMGLYHQEETESMREGKRLEPIALAKFCELMGIEFKPVVCQSAHLPWQIASLDGLSEDQLVIVEIKCSQKLYEQAKQGIIPQMYRDQIQHQLCVTNASYAYYYAYYDGEGVDIEVQPDDDYIAKIIERETVFYQRMVQFDPPEPDYINRDDDEWRSAVSEYKSIQNMLTQYEDLAKAAKNRLISLSNDRPSRGEGIRLQKIVRKGTIPYAEIEAIKAMDLEAYRKPSTEYWKISEEK